MKPGETRTVIVVSWTGTDTPTGGVQGERFTMTCTDLRDGVETLTETAKVPVTIQVLP